MRTSPLLLLLLLTPVAWAQAPNPAHVERWYEIARGQQKIGHQRVVWSPSTWQGKRTVHDSTTIVRRSVRDMAGSRDVFETTTVMELERGEDGTLWWLRSEHQEAGRTSITETTWSGKGYTHVSRIGGGEARTVEIPLDAPCMVDAEAFLGPRVKELQAGQKHVLRALDVAGKGAREWELTVLPAEKVEGEAGPVDSTPVRQKEPSGAETTFWLDRDGAFVRIVDDEGTVYRRTTREKAEEAPSRPHEYSVVCGASPTLERIFSAAKVGVDLHVQGDPNRRLPDLPTSPWSRVKAVRGSDAQGWVLELELTAHDDPSAQATFADVDRTKFAADLEPTNLMPSNHPQLVALAKQVVGDAKTLREGARRLARWTHLNLEKESPLVAESTALEILAERKGDCSEHCVLFVALCRAAGIPARRCSGFVCLGSIWGGHSFAEVWTGTWIGADGTTGEVGAGARYLFFGYLDKPDSWPTVVSGRLIGRMRFVTTSVTAPAEEGGETFDLRDPAKHRLVDRSAGTARHVLCGIEARGIPPEWRVDLAGATQAVLRGPGVSATLHVMADQGSDLESWGGGASAFCGVPAMIHGRGQSRTIIVHSRRRMVRIYVSEATEEGLKALEAVLAPTFRADEPATAAPAAGAGTEKPAPTTEKPAPPATEPPGR